MATTAIRLAAAEREMQTWQERFEDSRRNIDLLEIDCGRLHLQTPSRSARRSDRHGRSVTRGSVPAKSRRTYNWYVRIVDPIRRSVLAHQ